MQILPKWHYFNIINIHRKPQNQEQLKAILLEIRSWSFRVEKAVSQIPSIMPFFLWHHLRGDTVTAAVYVAPNM